jgi:hypothetical protein
MILLNFLHYTLNQELKYTIDHTLNQELNKTQ